MTDATAPEHLLLPPDPDDAPGWREWPMPARRRVALCALLDRIDELAASGAAVHVVVDAGTAPLWPGLGSALRSYEAAADVRPPGEGDDAEQVAMPADADRARRGPHGAAMLGPVGTSVRHLALTIAGTAGSAPADGPWQVVTDEGWRSILPREALLDPLRNLRPGQRLQAMVDAGPDRRVVSAWH